MARSSKIKCPSCDEEKAGAFCETCAAWKSEICPSCAEPLNRKAVHCNRCAWNRPWWRRLFVNAAAWNTTVSLLVALAGIALAGRSTWENYRNGDSHTMVSVTAADAATIHIVATNDGRRNSVIQQVTLTFGGLPIRAATLDFSWKDAVDGTIVRAGGEAHLTLIARSLSLTAGTKDELEPRLANARAELHAVVKESNELRTITESFPIENIREFIVEHVPVDRHP
jgi:hypothetical protein